MLHNFSKYCIMTEVDNDENMCHVFDFVKIIDCGMFRRYSWLFSR